MALITAVTLTSLWGRCSLQTGATCTVHIDQWSNSPPVGCSDERSLRWGWARRDIANLHKRVLAGDQSLSHYNTPADGRLELSGYSGGLFMLVNQKHFASFALLSPPQQRKRGTPNSRCENTMSVFVSSPWKIPLTLTETTYWSHWILQRYFWSTFDEIML